MKNKSAVISVLGLLAVLAGMSYAASGVRGAKSTTTIYGGTGAVGVSSTTAVLYGVILGTGAVTDYVTLFDSASASGIAAVNQTTAGFKMRLYASSATQNTVFSFDPPLQFRNGIMAANATSVMSSMMTWEGGRVAQGY